MWRGRERKRERGGRKGGREVMGGGKERNGVEGSCLNSVIYRVEMEAVIRRNGFMGGMGGGRG